MAWILSLTTFEGERVNTVPRVTDQMLVTVTQIKNRFFSPFRTLIYAQSFILNELLPMNFIQYINWVTGLLTASTCLVRLPASRFYRSSALCGRWSTASDIPVFFILFSLFGKTQHKLELLGPCLKTRDLLFLLNTTPRVTLQVTLVGTFSDLLRENWVRSMGVFPPSLHGVQRMPFRKCRLLHLQQCLTWERPRQKQCPLLSYFLELLSWYRQSCNLYIWQIHC